MSIYSLRQFIVRSALAKTAASFFQLLLACILTGSFFSCSPKSVDIEHGNLKLSFDDKLHCTVSSLAKGAKTLMETSEASEYLITKKFTARDFDLKHASSVKLRDSTGTGTEWTLEGGYSGDQICLTKTVHIKLYDDFPGTAVVSVIYVNHASKRLEVSKWVNHHYTIDSQHDTPLFWSFQGGSTSERKDWILPLAPGSHQKNYMGMNSTDAGGGIPVTDIWRKDQGIAIGHLDTIPRLVSLPVDMDHYETSVAIGVELEYEKPLIMDPGDSLNTLETFVSVHDGDYYNPLAQYGKMLRAKGLKFAEPEESAYESSWCTWGYMRDVTLDEITGTLRKVKELGIKWATIDDGFQQDEGDWHVNKGKFPLGDIQMKDLVDKIHEQGLKAMIWWTPLAVDPASILLKENPDITLINKDRAPQFITWWDCYYMSPVYQKTIAHTESVVDLFMRQWGFDGMKMDGQHMNAAPPDYNKMHHLKRPEESFEKLPEFFRMIQKKAVSLNPHAVIQNCPCGMCMSVFNMPYMNQAVASDPLSSWQIRHKGKTYKALLGKTAYFADHVELSDGGDDFATSFGIGAVLGTKFTWPKENPTVTENNLLTPEREKIWKKWFGLYNRKMLSKEKYLGHLYDIGYDIPETHVIQKGDTLHYAFYKDKWNGTIKLKGLDARRYRVFDYENNRDLGTVTGPEAELKTSFTKHLLLALYSEH